MWTGAYQPLFLNFPPLETTNVAPDAPEFTKALEVAQSALIRELTAQHLFARYSSIADWVGWALTAVVAIAAAARGLAPIQNQNPNPAPPNASRRLLVSLAVMAALASTAGGAGTRLATSADRHQKNAEDIRSKGVSLIAEGKGKSAEEQRQLARRFSFEIQR